MFVNSQEEGFVAESVKGISLPPFRWPLPPTMEQAADDWLSCEFQSLDLEKQDKANFDVMGMTQNDEKCKESSFVAAKLRKFELELQNILKRNDCRSKLLAYNQACRLEPSFVADSDTRMTFLCGDEYSAEAAAERYLTWLEIKMRLFGDGAVLVRTVRFSDLTESDSTVLASGFIQVLPQKDVSGRPVLAVFPAMLPSQTSIESMLRVVWYVHDSTMGDPVAARLGCVEVVYYVGPYASYGDLERITRVSEMSTALPGIERAVHLCYDSKLFRSFVLGAQLILPQWLRTRFRFHYGNHAEVAARLGSYGIPMKDFPVKTDASFSLEGIFSGYNIEQNLRDPTLRNHRHPLMMVCNKSPKYNPLGLMFALEEECTSIRAIKELGISLKCSEKSTKMQESLARHVLLRRL